ncbi:MAG: mechanosensitive ion channel family protein [Acidobacteriota bacterium]
MNFSAYSRVVCIALLGSFLLLSPTCGWAQGMGKVKPKAPPKEAAIPEDFKPEQVEGYIAGLTDEQARKVLATELKKKAAANSKKDGDGEKIGTRDTWFVAGFFAAQEALASISVEIERIIASAQASGESDVWEGLVGGRGIDRIALALASLFIIIFVGWSVERLLMRKIQGFQKQLMEGVRGSIWEKAGVFTSSLLLDCLGIGVYVGVTFGVYSILFGQKGTPYLVSASVIVSYYFRVVEMAARLAASPGTPELRLVPMNDDDARFFYRCILWITASLLPGTALALALQKSGASRELFLFVYSTAGPIVSIILSVIIWQVRRRVAEVICAPADSMSGHSHIVRQKCAESWHLAAILLVLGVGAYWWVRSLTHADATILKLLLSLFLVPLCIGMDRWLQHLFHRVVGRQKEVIDFSPPDVGEDHGTDKALEERLSGRDKEAGKGMTIYFPLLRKAFRIVLVLFLFFGTLEFWGVEFDTGWMFAKDIMGVMGALVLGLTLWEIVKARIDWGGSRKGTLLLLLRKFILVFLIIVVGFSILASLGVNIAPLLAGAGVVGLAIGFGSQTLVKDIIAGIFFLIDDAFRVGDYVEAGTAKGTVEHISLRSIRLRHPRGQIFVVPFGDLKMVQNFTRDYIIEKLDVRVGFDTDPDVIRKIVKKINKEIKKDEEFANALLTDIKSVGVRAMEDSAMIMRVKFKCIPGEQFILRREVYHRLQRAFKEKGIEFANRNVTVYLPPQSAQPTGMATPEIPPEAAGAAAAAALAQIEAEELARLTPKMKSE